VEKVEIKESPEETLANHLSIKQTSKMLNGDKKKADADAEFQPKNKSDFTQAALDVAWLKGIAKICKHSDNLRSNLQGRKPILKEDFNIEVIADSRVIENELRELKQNITDYLRKDLNNDFIQLSTKLADIKEQNDKAYFPDEIYKKMVEKNPELKNFRDQLDLEIDF
jgi:hypothetical protein